MHAEIPQIQFVEGRFSRVRVRAQDAIVVEVQTKLSDDELNAITTTLREVFPANKLLVLDEGMRITAFGLMDDDDDGVEETE